MEIMENKGIVYVSTYTHGKSKGIHILDMDIGQGTLTFRKEVAVHNPSYIVRSHSRKHLYSIADEGVEAYAIVEDGDLALLNKSGIRGMRGCFLCTDYEDRYLVVAGYHDGKVTVLSLNQDGSLGRITDQKIHTGLGSVAERSFRPHVCCVRMTPDNQYLCTVDLGLDHVKIYRLDKSMGKLELVDILRCPIKSAPRQILFSEDCRFAYVLCELSNKILVYSYQNDNMPEFTQIQAIDTLERTKDKTSAACAMKFSPDGNYIFCSNAGENDVAMYQVDKETGLLKLINILPVSGAYPKDIAFFPDGRHFMSLNHESNTITVFAIDYQRGLIVMKGKPIEVETPNSVIVSY